MSRKEKMKVYHGIPKSVTDEHTVFYASFDGILTPETGNTYECNYQSPKFVDSIIGYGLQNDVYTLNTKYSSPLQFENYDEVTIEFFYDATKVTTFSGNEHYGLYLKNKDIGIIRVLSFLNNNKTLSLRFYNSSGGTLDTITIKTEGLLNHIRLTYNRGIVNVYINGVKKLQYTKLVIDKIDNIFMYQLQAIVSDLHISNIDRGDYFPNLPQDFIDGKAIVKPRMGQQQIKGDPMYSQVTDVCIPHYADDTQHLYYTSGIEGYLINNLEIFGVRGATDWSRGSAFKIKGLNGEIISGVIDTDTALAFIAENSSGVTRTIKVSDISKLDVGDTFKIGFIDGTWFSTDKTIESIDDTNKTVTWSTQASSETVSTIMCLYETTASSSSPLVKTQDGTIVSGTWSGLGTNEATFTLGENVDISGKDLYVTYALTMPSGNSDFPELPHTIERAWGENGVEMKPVNQIAIVDDFRGKISGSLKECPHIAKAVAFTSLITPSEARWTEWTNYSKFIQLDNDIQSASTTLNGHIPMQLFSFNLIEMVERKLGCEIPNIDKAQWLKENYEYIEVRYTGYGTTPTGSLVKITIFDHSTNLWLRDWLSITTSSPSTKHGAFRGTENFNRIIPNGVLYVLAYTDPSDGVTTSVVCTDYISVEIKLKVDSTFTTLYCENTRAREDKCNPVLIQKETKTVKRYLPSKECFVTECVKLPYKSDPKCETGTILAVAKSKVLTTSGTGSKVEAVNGVSSYADKILLPTGYNFYNFDNSPIVMYDTEMVNNLSHTIHLPIIRHWGGTRYHGEGTTSSGLDSCQSMTTLTDLTHTPRYEFFGAIKEVNGELKLLIRTDMRLPDNAYPPSTYTNKDYILPNRPLIK